MKKEISRCKKAIALVKEKNLDVAIISSGDSTVYAMASLIYELAQNEENINIKVISGVTAALSGGALVGAPLSHDFAVISLSDLLTPWPLIEKRIRKASEGDFSISLYNPMSKKRRTQLKRACQIMLESKALKQFVQ